MKIKIKHFDKTLPLPSYKSRGAACVDLCARLDVKIPAGQIGYVPLNVALEIPKGYWILVAARSGTHKLGILPAHGIGIGDWDFRGDNDEYIFPFYNFCKETVEIKKGTRVAQMMILKYEKIEMKEVKKLTEKDRGKFGSTGMN